jgi:hypothetical protein
MSIHLARTVEAIQQIGEGACVMRAKFVVFFCDHYANG